MGRIGTLRTALLLVAVALAATTAHAESRADLERDARQALQSLLRGNSAASQLNKKAVGVLVFPSMVKAGFLFGGQIGDGVLFKGGRAAGAYNSVAASYGLQAGAQTFGYALFFMDKASLAYLDSSDGWEVGVGPSIVVVDQGAAKAVSSTTMTENVYAFIFNQKGLMGGLGVQGSKITKLSN